MARNHFKEECVLDKWNDSLQGKLGYCADSIEDLKVYVLTGDKPIPLARSELADMDLPFTDGTDNWKYCYYDPEADYCEVQGDWYVGDR